MRIYKWTLAMTDKQELSLHKGAKLLAVQVQRGIPQLWALVDEREQDRDCRLFATYGTGNAMPDDVGDYVGTYQLEGGVFVLHVFEVTE